MSVGETRRIGECLRRSHQLSLRLMHVQLCMQEGGVADEQATREENRIKKASAGKRRQGSRCGRVGQSIL